MELLPPEGDNGYSDLVVIEDWSDSTGLAWFSIGAQISSLEAIASRDYRTVDIGFTESTALDYEIIITNSLGIDIPIDSSNFVIKDPGTSSGWKCMPPFGSKVITWDCNNAFQEPMPVDTYTISMKYTSHATYFDSTSVHVTKDALKSRKEEAGYYSEFPEAPVLEKYRLEGRRLSVLFPTPKRANWCVMECDTIPGRFSY